MKTGNNWNIILFNLVAKRCTSFQLSALSRVASSVLKRIYWQFNTRLNNCALKSFQNTTAQNCERYAIKKSIRKMESTKANNYWCQFYHLFSSFRLFCGQDEWCPNITTFIRLIFKTKTNSYLFVHKNKAKSGIDSTHKDMFSLTLSDRCQVTDDRWQVTGDSRHSKSRFLLRGQLLTLKKIAIENAQKYSKSHIKGAKTWRKKKVKMHEFSGLSVHISRVCANSAKFCAGTGDLLAIKCLPEQWYPPWNKHEHKQYQTTWLRLN